MHLTGQVPFAASPASVLAWLRDYEPHTLAATRWTMFCKDWVRLRLTGEVATDPTEASASFLDLYDRSWSSRALELYGLGMYEKTLPPSVAAARSPAMSPLEQLQKQAWRRGHLS